MTAADAQQFKAVNDKLQSANMKVALKIAPDKGVGLFSLSSISDDETVFSENPILAGQYSWGVVYGYSGCHHCLRSLESAEDMAKRLTNDVNTQIPFPQYGAVNSSAYRYCQGCNVAFCSESCLSSALSSYHTPLCIKGNPSHPLLAVDEMWRNLHFPPETTSLTLLLKIIGTVITTGSLPEVYRQFCASPVTDGDQSHAKVHKLLQPEFIVKIDQLRDALLQCFDEPSVARLLERDNFISLIALIGMNGQGIGTSTLASYCNTLDALELSKDERDEVDSRVDQLWDAVDKHSGIFTDCEGTGLYELQSRINHSCSPNVEIQFTEGNARLSVKALRDIVAGEELFISYMSGCELDRSRHSRQKYLLENYLFECWCIKCDSERGQEDLTSDEESDEEMED